MDTKLMSILVIAATFVMLFASSVVVSSVYAERAIGKGQLCKEADDRGDCQQELPPPGQAKKIIEEPPV